MAASPPQRSSSQIWREFKGRHPGHPFLKHDAIYALSPDIIRAIQKECPGFFSADDEHFEWDLLSTAKQGFFYHQVIGECGTDETGIAASPSLPADCPSLAPAEPSRVSKAERTQAKNEGPTIEVFLKQKSRLTEAMLEKLGRLVPTLDTGHANDSTKEAISIINKFMAVMREASGLSAYDVAAARAQEEQESAIIRNRQEAYAGWLITNSTYRRELAILRHRGKGFLNQNSEFPNALNETGPSDDTTVRLSFEYAYHAFLQRWCLEKLLTWDVPVPWTPSFSTGLPGATEQSREGGVIFFVPWYMLRGHQFDLQEVAQRLRFESAPEHLRNWVMKSENAGGQDSDMSFQKTFWLYRCYELVLLRRYPTACVGNIESLDQAMATVMDRGVDVVKRLRQHLGKSLRGSTGRSRKC